MFEEENNNNAYIDILNLEINFKTDREGSLYISAGYCDIDLPGKDRVTLANDVMIIKMNKDEKIQIRNVVDLSYLKFKGDKN